jgi:hypothetical protein
MSATVNIVLAQNDNVLLVPSLAISTSGDVKTVQMWNNGKLSTRKVIIGIND